MRYVLALVLLVGILLSFQSFRVSLSDFSYPIDSLNDDPLVVRVPSNNTVLKTNLQIETPNVTNQPNTVVALSSNQSDAVVLGKRYSAQACFLDPAWGRVENITEGECIGTDLKYYNTTATHLSCSDDKPLLRDRRTQGLTIALLYFAKPSMLFHQLDTFISYPEEIKQNLTILLVDDGSPPGLRVTDYFDNTTEYRSHFRIRLATITTQKDWNIGGARNLAFYLADTPNTLLLDLDMIVPVETIQHVMTWQTRSPTQIVAHRFNRKRPDGRLQKHPAVSLMETNAYWESGGCDEDFCGNYGYTDVHFWHRWKMDTARIQNDHMDMYIHEYGQPACNSTHIPAGPERDKCQKARKAMKKPSKERGRNLSRYTYKTQNGCWSNRYLRFRWILNY